MTRTAAAMAAGAWLSACGADTAEGPNLLVPDDVEVRWSEAFDAEGDGLAALVPVDFMVYDAQSGEPLASVPLQVQVPDGRSVASGSSDDGAVLIVTPDHVDVSAGACEDCAVWWDAWRDQYFEFAPHAEPTASLSITTDPTGLARVYVFVDSFSADTGTFQPALLSVSIAEVDETFLLVPR